MLVGTASCNLSSPGSSTPSSPAAQVSIHTADQAMVDYESILFSALKEWFVDEANYGIDEMDLPMPSSPLPGSPSSSVAHIRLQLGVGGGD